MKLNVFFRFVYRELCSSHFLSFLNENSMQKNAKHILPVIFLTILVIMVLYAIFPRNICTAHNKSLLYENFEYKQQIWATTFGGGGQNFYEAVDRISNELKTTNVFDRIVPVIDTDLKNDKVFWNTHCEFIEKNKRGYGYWIWKPYLIMKTLEVMQNNDILFYIDSGCEIADYSQESIELLKKIIENCNTYNILYTQTSHDEKSYTKMDVFAHLNLINEDIMNSIENQATVIIIKKTKLTVEFIKEWYNSSCNYNLINDEPSILQNHPTFIENRHDQSIFSLLLKTDKYKQLNTANNILNEPYPILLSRKRSG